MNTLSKQHTKQLFQDENGWLALKAKWSELVNSDKKDELTAAHHLLANAALGRNYRKGFTPIDPNSAKGKQKLKSRISPDWNMKRALWQVKYHGFDPHFLLDPFDGLISLDALKALSHLLPVDVTYDKTRESLEDDAFPFAEPIEAEPET